MTLSTVLPSIVNTELSSGIPMPRIVERTLRVEPDAIADAIVASVSHRRAEVAVPRWLGAYPIVQPLVPEFVENLVRRLFDDDAALTTSTLPAAPPTTSASPGRFRPRTPPP